MVYKCFISRWKRETNVFLRVSHCLKVIRLMAQILESCPPNIACSQWDYLPIHTLGTAKNPRNESFSELPVLHRDTQGAMEHCTPWLLFPNRYVRCYHAVEHLPSCVSGRQDDLFLKLKLTLLCDGLTPSHCEQHLPPNGFLFWSLSLCQRSSSTKMFRLLWYHLLLKPPRPCT